MDVTNPWIALGLIATLTLVAWVWLYARASMRTACPRCYFPKYRCECKSDCPHARQFPPIWSQDGWIAKCKDCGEIVYLGDDYDGGPDARNDVAA